MSAETTYSREETIQGRGLYEKMWWLKNTSDRKCYLFTSYTFKKPISIYYLVMGICVSRFDVYIKLIVSVLRTYCRKRAGLVSLAQKYHDTKHAT